MMDGLGRALRACAWALLAFTACFALLGVDVIVRIWTLRGTLDRPGTVELLIAYEAVRVLVVAGAVIVAAGALWRAARVAAAGPFAVLVTSLALWYAKAFAFAAFPGYLQERLAGWLLNAGVPFGMLRALFGEPSWALWIAVAALLRLSTVYPGRPAVDAIRATGAADRTGLMRSVALAGIDVGAAFRRAAAGAVTRGWLGQRPVLAVGIAGAVASHFAARHPVVQLVLAAVACALGAVAVTNLRAGYFRATPAEADRILNGLSAALVALFAFLASAVLAAAGDPAGAAASATIVSVAPVAALLLVARAGRGRGHGRVTLRRVVRTGVTGAAAAVGYAVLARIAGPLGLAGASRAMLAIAGAALGAAAAWRVAVRISTPLGGGREEASQVRQQEELA